MEKKTYCIIIIWSYLMSNIKAALPTNQRDKPSVCCFSSEHKGDYLLFQRFRSTFIRTYRLITIFVYLYIDSVVGDISDNDKSSTSWHPFNANHEHATIAGLNLALTNAHYGMWWPRRLTSRLEKLETMSTRPTPARPSSGIRLLTLHRRGDFDHLFTQ